MSNIFTIKWSDGAPPKKYTVSDIISNLPCKYMAWMEGSEWPIYMTFIDRMADTTPRSITGIPDFADSRLNLGHWLRGQGPTEAQDV